MDPENNYINKTLIRSILINDILTINPTIEIPSKAFLLEKYDFDKLINGKSWAVDLETTLRGTCVGLFLNMIGKYVASKVHPETSFEPWEVYVFSGALLAWSLVYFIERFVKSERKKIIRTIKNHFNID